MPGDEVNYGAKLLLSAAKYKKKTARYWYVFFHAHASVCYLICGTVFTLFAVLFFQLWAE